jgi:ATP-binding cassette subfamily B protein
MDRAPGPGWPALARLLRTFAGPYGGRIGLVFFLLVLQVTANLYLPVLSGDVVNGGVLKGDIGYIWRSGAIMLVLSLVIAILSILIEYHSIRVALGSCSDMRAAVYRQVQSFTGREMTRFGIPTLITRNINDVDQVEEFIVVALSEAVLAVIMSVGGMVMAVWEGRALSLLLAVTIPIMGVIIAVALVRSVPLSRSMQLKTDRLNGVMREQITGIRVIRAFQRTRTEQERFSEVNSDITGTGLRLSRIFALGVPLLLCVLNLASVGVIWFGGRLVSEGAMPLGNMTAFLIYLLQFLLYALVAVSALFLIPRAVASGERVAEVLGTEPSVVDRHQPYRPPLVNGMVEFRQATFGYPGSERPVLRDLNFLLLPGQVHGIIGGTGSGKTTLLNLILRFFDVTDGAVLVNGTDVRAQGVEPLRSPIGLVPQSSFLFSGTIASNLRFSRPGASDAELWRALKVAQASEFVVRMPGQLEAVIDQGGTNVSGGQRQRLSIARALVRRSQLYLFDDCFSALDAATDARLRAALRSETVGASSVIVAQRVSTVMDADQIIVLDGGTVAGIGTHRQLLSACVPYQEIVASQLGEGVSA